MQKFKLSNRIDFDLLSKRQKTHIVFWIWFCLGQCDHVDGVELGLHARRYKIAIPHVVAVVNAIIWQAGLVLVSSVAFYVFKIWITRSLCFPIPFLKTFISYIWELLNLVVKIKQIEWISDDGYDLMSIAKMKNI